MWTGWVIAGCVLGAIAAVIVWALIVAILVVHIEDTHHHFVPPVEPTPPTPPTPPASNATAADREPPNDRVPVP